MLERPDRALVAWGAALRRDKGQRRKLVRRCLWCGSLCGALLATIALPPRPRLAWNASASMPLGLYRVEQGVGVNTGDLVVARLPARTRLLAARRHYLPLGVPLIKDVAAIAGARVCAAGNLVRVDDFIVAIRRRTDRRGRDLPWWQGCRTLSDGEVFLLGRSPDSFDGRYFGPTRGSDIVGKAKPLWVR